MTDYQQINDDLIIRNGDFVVTSDVIDTYKVDLLIEDVGARRLRPLRGVGLARFINIDGSNAQIRRRIKEVAKIERARVQNITVSEDGTIDFDLSYD